MHFNLNLKAVEKEIFLNIKKNKREFFGMTLGILMLGTVIGIIFGVPISLANASGRIQTSEDGIYGHKESDIPMYIQKIENPDDLPVNFIFGTSTRIHEKNDVVFSIKLQKNFMYIAPYKKARVVWTCMDDNGKFIRKNEAIVPLGKEIKIMKKDEISDSGIKAIRFHVKFEQINNEENDEINTENLDGREVSTYDVIFSVYET